MLLCVDVPDGVVAAGVVVRGTLLVGTVGVVVAGTVVVGTVATGGTVAAGVVAGDEAAGTVTVVGAGADSGVSSSVTSATAIPAASSASSTAVSAIGVRQLGGGWTRVRAARPHSRHQLCSSGSRWPQRGHSNAPVLREADGRSTTLTPANPSRSSPERSAR